MTAQALGPGDGLSHPEHRGPGRIPTGDRNDSGGTPPGDISHHKIGVAQHPLIAVMDGKAWGHGFQALGEQGMVTG